MQTYHSGANGRIAETVDIMAGIAAAERGIETAWSHCYGTDDPSIGATPEWGADEYGRTWTDANDPDNPILKRWEKLDGSAEPWGWRVLRVPLIKHIPEAQWFDLPASTPSPQAADVPWTNESLTVPLDGVQDVPLKRVTAVLVMVQVIAAGDITAADDGYFAVRTMGSAGNGIRVFAQAQNRPFNMAPFWLVLDGNEEFEWEATVGITTPGFAHTAKVVAYAEEV